MNYHYLKHATAIVLRLATSLLLVSCIAPTKFSQSGPENSIQADWTISVATNPDDCRTALQTTPNGSTHRLDQASMRLLNWNTQKRSDASMQADLTKLTEGVDLILLQEAVSNSAAFEAIDTQYHWSFSPGYQQKNRITGVMTASRIRPLARCSLTNYEPWLRSPKATNITEFALSGTDETLLVVNLHLINFTVGTREMAQQLIQALSYVEAHKGPVIVSGDFNTWRKGRRDLVETALTAHGLNPVSYKVDYRKRFFGYALDHTFVRGMQISNGTSHFVNSSDHNPMSVTLEF